MNHQLFYVGFILVTRKGAISIHEQTLFVLPSVNFLRCL